MLKVVFDMNNKRYLFPLLLNKACMKNRSRGY